jgi:hypothetical protein
MKAATEYSDVLVREFQPEDATSVNQVFKEGVYRLHKHLMLT